MINFCLSWVLSNIKRCFLKEEKGEKMPDALVFATLCNILQKEGRYFRNWKWKGSWLVQSHCYLNCDLSHSFSSSSRAFPASHNTTVRSTSRFHHNNINNLLSTSLPLRALCSFRYFSFFVVLFKELRILHEQMEIKRLYFASPLIRYTAF